MIAVVVVNFQRASDTLVCLRALERCTSSGGEEVHVVLVDNGVGPGETDPVIADHVADSPAITYIPLEENAGFAGACNRAIDWVLAQQRFQAVALLNNDAIVSPGWLDAMAARLDPAAKVEMVAARMVVADRPEEIDSLGIALYRSGFAANRKSIDDPLLGPCGGAALYSVRLLRTICDASGYVFDEDFFCYAEDTDLALRAKLLGFQAAYAEGALVRHRGSLTSGGPDSDFVMYYGLRNSLCVMRRDLPFGFVLRYWPWMAVARLGVLAKYLRQRRLRLLWTAYRDYVRRRGRDRECRRALRKQGVLRWSRISSVVSPSLYDRTYVREQLHALAHFAPTRGGADR